MKNCAVLGAGLSGLSVGYYIRRLPRRFNLPLTIYESTNRVGGWIRTENYKDKGFIFETAGRTIRPKGVTGANTLELIEDLDLPIDAISTKHVAAKNRMIFANGKLCLLPNSLSGIFKTVPPFSEPLAKAVLHDLFGKRLKIRYADESVYSFIERRFGKEIADYAISPIICGICAGDAKEISVRFLMDDMFQNEQKWGSVTSGLFLSKLTKKSPNGMSIFGDRVPDLYEQAKTDKWSMYRLRGGLELLPRALSKYLKQNDVNIEMSAECREIVFKREGAKMSIQGRSIHADHIISAMPADKLATCVKNQHPSLAALLNSIPYVDVGVVNLQYNTSDILKYKAFGFLVPPIERLPILGVIFDSCCFHMHGNTVLTVMMGGKWFKEIFGKNPTQKMLLDTALQQVESILGIDIEPSMSKVHILPKCIPQYLVGHKHQVESIRRYIKNYNIPLSLCGAAYDGIGINDVIFSGRRAASNLPEHLGKQ